MKKSMNLLLLLGVAVLAAVIYIYMYATDEYSAEPTSTEILENGGMPAEEAGAEVADTDESVETAPEESIAVSPDALSDGQKQFLETLGVDTNNIVITPTMISCAEEKVGEERMQEIQNGATPSFLEGMLLIGCYE